MVAFSPKEHIRSYAYGPEYKLTHLKHVPPSHVIMTIVIIIKSIAVLPPLLLLAPSTIYPSQKFSAIWGTAILGILGLVSVSAPDTRCEHGKLVQGCLHAGRRKS